jgi:hypothetical protein
MADSFINKLTESTTVKGTDFTAFDIADPATGGYFTKKVSFDNLTSKIKTEVNTTVQTQIDNLQRNLNTVSQSIANKLDKNGLTFSPVERMNGTLVVNATLSGLGKSHFNSTVDVHNNFIINVKDPVNNYDAVNLHTVNDKIAAIQIPNTANYVLKSGDTMTGALVLAADPTQNLQAAPKQYVDKSNPFGKFLPLSGGEMTGSLVLKGFSEKSTLVTGTGSVSLNLDNGNTFPINLTGNVTGFTLAGTVPSDSFSITMFITQTGTFSVAFTIGGTVVKWANGVVPTMTNTSGKTDVFAFTKIGANWYGFIGGQNF